MKSGRAKIWTLLFLSVFLAGALAAEPPAPSGAASAMERRSDAAPGDEDPDVELLERLQEAADAYEAGLTEFREGRDAEGRARLNKAFAILTASLEEEQLPLELKADFQSMLEKVRTWESAGDEKESPSELDASDDVLKEIAAQPVSRAKGAAKHAIKIDPANEITRKYIQLYTQKRRDSVEEALARSGRYFPLIDEALKKAGLPRELFYLVMAESEYKLHAVSRSGAAGLWQFMPFTARKYGLEVSYWIDERFLPEKATQAALRYLKDLHQWFGDWHLAMAAYNRGENGLGRDMEFTRSSDFGTLSDRNALPDETHHYVPKFMACVLIGENPADYGLDPEYEKPEPYDVVKLERDLDLGIAAKCAGTTKAALQQLNPHIRAWCTPKNRKDFELRIPKGTEKTFFAELSLIKDWNPGPEVLRHEVRRGDNLGTIARRYRTTVKAIVRLNNIRNPKLIRPGMRLNIEPGKSFRR